MKPQGKNADKRVRQVGMTWRTVFSTLALWAKCAELEEFNRRLPAKETIQLAAKVGELLWREGKDSPTRIIADSSGGIKFDWKIGGIVITVYVWEDDKVEQICFLDSKIILRKPFCGV